MSEIKKFLVRIELHSARPADYDELHAEMEKAQFVRHIEDANGQKFQLPTAEYIWTGAEEREFILKLVQVIVGRTEFGKKRSLYSVLVVEMGQIAFKLEPLT